MIQDDWVKRGIKTGATHLLVIERDGKTHPIYVLPNEALEWLVGKCRERNAQVLEVVPLQPVPRGRSEV